MTITINKTPKENGTAEFTIVFKDSQDNTVTPATSFWQLMYPNGNIVTGYNDTVRSFANGTFTGNTVILRDADLAITGDGDTAQRIFAIKATYNSDLGIGLPLNDEYPFPIKKLVSQDDIS